MGNPTEKRTKFLTNSESVERYAIASKIVTKAQFRHFQQANPDVRKPDIEQYSRSDDSPQVDVDWYDAARYCNWLSKNEGIPKEQWCYEPNDQGKYAEGMKPAPIICSAAGIDSQRKQSGSMPADPAARQAATTG